MPNCGERLDVAAALRPFSRPMANGIGVYRDGPVTEAQARTVVHRESEIRGMSHPC